MPKMDQLRKSTERLAKMLGKSFTEVLDMDIRGRIGDIVKSTEIIEREQQRIRKAKKSIEMILTEQEGSKQAKEMSKRFYEDLLIYGVSLVRDKIKK